MTILFYYFLMATIVGFTITGYDKYLVKKHQRRISEKTLLSLVVLGGTIGVGLAMFFFRHKIAKTSFLLKYFGVVLLQIIVIYLIFARY